MTGLEAAGRLGVATGRRGAGLAFAAVVLALGLAFALPFARPLAFELPLALPLADELAGGVAGLRGVPGLPVAPDFPRAPGAVEDVRPPVFAPVGACGLAVVVGGPGVLDVTGPGAVTGRGGAFAAWLGSVIPTTL